jgi:hypothetical protein
MWEIANGLIGDAGVQIDVMYEAVLGSERGAVYD